MEDKAKQKLNQGAFVWSLVLLHLWASILVVAVIQGKANTTIGDMFSSILFAIWGMLIVAFGGKGAKDLMFLHYGNGLSKGYGQDDRGERSGSMGAGQDFDDRGGGLGADDAGDGNSDVSARQRAETSGFLAERLGGSKGETR